MLLSLVSPEIISLVGSEVALSACVRLFPGVSSLVHNHVIAGLTCVAAQAARKWSFAGVNLRVCIQAFLSFSFVFALATGVRFLI